MANIVDLTDLTNSLQSFQVEIERDELIENWGEWAPKSGQPEPDDSGKLGS
jgi:hypothetical protein